jgi:hypothetical protein
MDIRLMLTSACVLIRLQLKKDEIPIIVPQGEPGGEEEKLDELEVLVADAFRLSLSID